jgi:hypothetical protein
LRQTEFDGEEVPHQRRIAVIRGAKAAPIGFIRGPLNVLELVVVEHGRKLPVDSPETYSQRQEKH